MIPIVLTRLSIEEANVWFLFATFTTIGQAIQFGFSTTFVRFIAYSFSGVSIKNFASIKENFKNYKEIQKDDKELSKILTVLKRVFVILSVGYFIILIILGTWALYDPISLIEDSLAFDGWLAWWLVVINSAICVYLGVYQIYLNGINQVSLIQKITATGNIGGIILILIVSVTTPTLLNIVIVQQLILLINFIIFRIVALRVNNRYLKSLQKYPFDRKVFSLVWDSAWKSGVTTIIANTVKHISGVLVAQWFAPSISASFLLTKRLFEILETFTMITFQAKIPTIASLRGKSDFKALLPLLKRVLILSYGVFIAGYIGLITIGEDVITYIKGNVQLGSIDLIICFSLSHFLSRWSGFGLAISNQSNNVIEHISAVIVATAYSIFILLFYSYFEILVFPLATIASIFASIPFLIRRAYSSINTSLWEFEKNRAIPMLIILLLINVLYYLLNI